jgi:hypothetical protein
MDFEVVGPITNVETVAIGSNIRVLPYLKKTYGRGRWRKLKGTATIRLPNGACVELKGTGSKRTESASATSR